MIYKCKKCEYITEDSNRQACPLCGNKYDKKKKEEKEIQQKIELKKSQQLHCPNCNSTNIKRISTSSRMLSGLTFGILSSNIGKTYQCNNCKYKW